MESKKSGRMWSPTHVQVTVQRARNLLTKGKHGTNNCFVVIALDKEKYQTSVKEKATDTVEWREKCELQIPDHGNTAEIILTVLHHNIFGIDEFLGCVTIPLAELDVYEWPKNRWLKLRDKPGKDKDKDRGELEVKVGFTVKGENELIKKEKHRSSLGQISHTASTLGGSLISLSSVDKKSFKKLAKSIGNKVRREKKLREEGNFKGSGSISGLAIDTRPSVQRKGDADPGVISDDDEFAFEDLSQRGSTGSLSFTQTNTPVSGSMENLAGGEFLRKSIANSSVGSNPSTTSAPAKPPRATPPEPKVDEWEQKLYAKKDKDISVSNLRRHHASFGPADVKDSLSPETPSSTPGTPATRKNMKLVGASEKSTSMTPPPTEKQNHSTKSKDDWGWGKAKQLISRATQADLKALQNLSPKMPFERIIIGGENEKNVSSRLSPEIAQKFQGKTRDDLILLAHDLQNQLNTVSKQKKDLEEYLDNLLLRVMETSPRILQTPFLSCKSQANIKF
nr:PREDICTED: rab11 family-interacting protein 1 isoform X2 [Bemisia tabaci]